MYWHVECVRRYVVGRLSNERQSNGNGRLAARRSSLHIEHDLGKGFDGPEENCRPEEVIGCFANGELDCENARPNEKTDEKAEESLASVSLGEEKKLDEDGEFETGHVDGFDFDVERKVVVKDEEEVDEGRCEVGDGPEKAQSHDRAKAEIFDDLR